LNPKICWKKELRRFIGDRIKVTTQFSRKRPNRRFRYDFPGRKPKRNALLLVAVDTSGNLLSGLQIPAYDYVDLSYTGSNLTGVIFKTGGAGGVTVSTLTLGYDGSDNLTSVTKI